MLGLPSKYLLSPLQLSFLPISMCSMPVSLSSPLCLSLSILSSFLAPNPFTLQTFPSQLENQMHVFLLALEISHNNSDHINPPLLLFLAVQMPIIPFWEKMPVPHCQRPCSQAKVSEHSKPFSSLQKTGAGIDIWTLGSDIEVQGP